MKKNYLLSMALAAMVSCSSEEFTGEQTVREVNEDVAISFNLNVPTVTRADQTGVTAATTLGRQFIVWGEKDEAADGTAAGDGKLVFKNYLVNYTAGTAYQTTSNTQNWEYVGLMYNDEGYSPSYSSNVSPLTSNATTEGQKIKYWDYSANNYVFTAVSALKTDIESGNVKISKIQSDATSSYNKGYTVTLEATAHPENLYFSDRQVINQGTGTNRDAANAYGGNVTLKFRNAISQIRVGMYETLPGHKVKIDKFYYATTANPGFDAMSTGGTDAFYANVPNITTSTGVTLTVTYQSSGAAVNNPKISVGGTTNNYIKLGANIMNATELETTSADPTWDTSGGTYTKMFSQETNDKNLKLKVDYTLTATDTGEEIKVTGATAQIPSQYLQWKPNYKYTYLFKISDNSNGSTGGDVVGLYPITFDAVAVVAEDGGEAEYITTVSEPSITTFGVKDGKYTYGQNEYKSGTTIYVTCVKSDGSVFDPDLGSDTHIYSVTTSDPTNFPITEASVAESQEHPSGNKITVTHECCGYNSAAKVTSVPAEDGTTKTINAIRFTPTNITSPGKTFAIRYTVSIPSGYSEGTVLAAGTSLEGYYRDKFVSATGTAVDGTAYYEKDQVIIGKVLPEGTLLDGYYTDDECNTACTTGTEADGSSTYYIKVDTYTEVTTLTVGDDVTSYYVTNGKKACGDSEWANGVNKYYTPTTAPGYAYKIIKVIP